MTLTKTPEQERIANSRMIDDFELAFILGDIYRIKYMMHNQGLFFGKQTKASAVGRILKILNSDKAPSEQNNYHINRGFTSNGAEVLEIRASQFMKFNENDEPVILSFGEPADQSINEVVYRFAFGFKDGKMISIQHPKRFHAKIDKFIEGN
jgi:hypothetical protein